MNLQIDDRVGVLSTSWLFGDEIEMGTVVGIVFDKAVAVKLDSAEEHDDPFPEFDIENGYEIDTFFPRILIECIQVGNVSCVLRSNVFKRILQSTKFGGGLVVTR